MNFSNLSDSALDAAYAASFDARDYQSAFLYGGEIINRTTTVGSFLNDLFWLDRFPKYHARNGSADAWGSVSVGVSQAPQTIADVGESVVDKGANVIKTAFSGVLIAIALGVVVIYFIERK